MHPNSTFHATETSVLTTWPSVTCILHYYFFISNVLAHYLRYLRRFEMHGSSYDIFETVEYYESMNNAFMSDKHLERILGHIQDKI